MPLVHRYHHSQGRLSFSDVYSEVTGKEHPGFNSSGLPAGVFSKEATLTRE